MKKLVLAFTLLLSLPLSAQLWTGLIDSSRAVNWADKGVLGGIPTRTVKCSTLGTAGQLPSFVQSVTNTQVNNAIQACGVGQVVFLNPGTYNIGTNGGPGCGNGNGIQMCGKSGVTLRGAGANQTFLVFNNDSNCHGEFSVICIDSSDTNWQGGPSHLANWTANYTKGTTVITLSTVSGLSIGNMLILDQVDDGADTGTKFVCQSTSISPPCSLEGNSGNSTRLNRDQTQVVQVTNISGNNVTITPGLYADNWADGKSPAAWWTSSPASGVGIEDLSIDVSGDLGPRGITFFNAIDSWVKGVRSIDTGKAHVELGNSQRITVRDNYFYLTQNSVSQSYGIETFNSSDVLIENNIFQYIAAPWMINGPCSGCVLGYNFGINDYFTLSTGYVAAASNHHTAGVEMILTEGNIGAQIYGDNFHGTHNLMTHFRDYIQGNEPACYNGTPFSFSPCTTNQVPFDVRAYSRLYNIIGSVLGQTSVHTIYENYTGGPTSGKPIYNLGFGNTGGINCPPTCFTVPPDTLVRSTLYRWGNWDTVTNATRWCGNSSNTGWATTCNSTSEVPTGLSSYAQAVPSTETLPASFYLSSKPSFFTASKPWPPIGPDVTGGNISGVGGHAYTIPAQDCYLNVMGGPNDGTGPVLSFNANTCYSQTVVPPAATTGGAIFAGAMTPHGRQ